MPAVLANRETRAGMSVTIFLVCLYIAVSGSLITFNKWLVHDGRFPFAQSLVMIHSGFASTCAALLFCAVPSMFPSLTSPTEKIAIDWDLMSRGILPIALFFSVQLVLSNSAYLHSSMAFLQMMKESNLVLVYILSLLVATETFGWTKVKIIAMIVFATALTIHGELAFSLKGFILQGTSQFFEASKIVLQALLLSSAGRKLDVLSYVLLVMPACFAVLSSAFLLLVYVHPIATFATPQWADVAAWWPVLLANASIAFGLNITIAFLLKHSSAVGFILAGICKDAIIVMVGAAFLHEPISKMQALGFFLQLCFVCTWSLMKTFPDKFENGVIEGLRSLREPASEDKGLSQKLPAEYGTVEDKGEKASQC